METKPQFPNNGKPIGLCSDHAGYELKQYIISLLNAESIPFKDFGCYSSESCDYPDFAHPMGAAIDKGECEVGISVCGTGNGISMALNKHKYVRSAICWSTEVAYFAKAHNNANVLTLPGRMIAKEEAYRIMTIFFNTQFEGGRHQRRIEKIPLE